MYGDFRTLTKKVKTVTASVEGMLTAIFRRLISEDETGNLEKVNGYYESIYFMLE